MLILSGRSRRIAPFFLAALLVPVMSAVQPSGLLAQPPLKWVKGKITQILVQPRESFYTFMLRDTNGAATLVRLCDPSTGKAAPVKADDPPTTCCGSRSSGDGRYRPGYVTLARIRRAAPGKSAWTA